MSENEETPEVTIDGDEFDGDVVLVEDVAAEYKPKVPGWLRDVVYYAGIAAAVASIMLPLNETVTNATAAIGLVSSMLAKVYRSK